MIEGNLDVYSKSNQCIHIMPHIYHHQTDTRVAQSNVLLPRPAQLLATLGTSHSSALPLRAGCRGGPSLESVGPPKVSPVELSSQPRGVSARSAWGLIATGGILRASTSTGPPIGCCCLCFVYYAYREKLEIRKKKKKDRPHHHS